MATLVIHGILPDFNDVINVTKSHWSAYSKAKKTWTEDAWTACKQQRVRPVKGQCRLHFLWHTPDLRKDPDNVCFAKKYILDGMVLAGVIETDGRRHVSGFSDNFAVDKDDPRVEVTIEPAE